MVVVVREMPDRHFQAVRMAVDPRVAVVMHMGLAGADVRTTPDAMGIEQVALCEQRRQSEEERESECVVVHNVVVRRMVARRKVLIWSDEI